MAMIDIQNLSFSYPGASCPIFNDITLNLDTNWRLGLVGRNGRGKTTLLNLLQGKLHGTGTILSPEKYEYCPMDIPNKNLPALCIARQIAGPFDEWEAMMQEYIKQPTPHNMQLYGDIESAYAKAGGYCINESITAESGRLGVEPEALGRQFSTLSGGEQVKIMLAALFLKKHRFLLIDEPTNHLDTEGRKLVSKWLASKNGFILVSHDRQFLDNAVDHILAINKTSIELQKGNFSSWKHNREIANEHEAAQNKKLESDISRLKTAAKKTEEWSGKAENAKFQGRGAASSGGAAFLDKGYIGHKAAKMMQRSKSIEKRISSQIEQKKSLLNDLEKSESIIFHQISHAKPRLFSADNISLCYKEITVFSGLSFDVLQGDRISVSGANGCGKTSLLKIIAGIIKPNNGAAKLANSVKINYVPQDTSFLTGSLQDFAKASQLDASLFFTLLRKMDFERSSFEQNMETLSKGQQKKVCIASSLSSPAHLFLWDEPLNYIDVLSREQIEDAVLSSKPTIIFVEHDAVFAKKTATKFITL